MTLLGLRMKSMEVSLGSTLSTLVMNMIIGVVKYLQNMKPNTGIYAQMKLLLKLTCHLKDKTVYLLEDSLSDLGLMGLVTLNGIVVTRVNTYNYFFLNLEEYTLLIRGRNSRNSSYDGCVIVEGNTLLVHTAMAQGEEITL